MNSTGNDRIKEPKKVVVQNLVFVVLFVLSLFGNAIDSKANARQAAEDQPCFKSNKSHNWPSHGLDFPFGSQGTAPGETPNEKDSEKEIDDEDGKEYWHRSINKTVAIISIESSWQCCSQLSENHHNNVSLFILYHSWKSYLS